MKKTLIFIGLFILFSGSMTLIQYQERLAEARTIVAAPATEAALEKTSAAPVVPAAPAEEEEDDIWDGECH